MMLDTHFFSVDLASCLAVVHQTPSENEQSSPLEIKKEQCYEATMRIKLRYQTQWPSKTSRALFFILCTFIDECIAREEGESWMHQSLQMHYFNELNAGDQLLILAEKNLFQEDEDPVISDALMIITNLGYQGAFDKNPELKKKIKAGIKKTNPKKTCKKWLQNTNILSMTAITASLVACTTYRAIDVINSKNAINSHIKKEAKLES